MNICFLGNMLGRNEGFITTQGQIVADLFENDGCRVTSASSKLNRAARLTEIVQTLVKGRKKFDVVLIEVYSGMNFVVANTVATLCKMFGLPLILVLHGGNLPEFIKKYPRWTRSALDKADVIVAPSRFLAEQIGKWGYQIKVIPNVVDISQYEFRKRSKISPKLIWMRSFHSIYNPEMAIRVLQRLCQRGQDATLTMAGKDKGLEDSLKQMAEELELSDRVRFVGFLDSENKLRELAESDIYINTNRIDNMPVSIVEARALGLPVVSTDVGGLPYLINHREDGLLVPDDDFKAMVKNIELLLDNPDLTRKISRNGRAIAEKSDWSKVQGEWENLILQVAGERSVKKNNARIFENKIASEKLESKL